MTGILALACFATGSVVAWLLRTGWVVARLSLAQEQMERKVRYWQSEAIYARNVAGNALHQLAAIAAHGPGPGPAAHGQRPGGT